MADLATSVHVDEPAPPAAVNDRPDFWRVPLDRIRVHPLNLRRELRDLDELADSIRQNGLVEPVVLVLDPEAQQERFLLVAGHRRHAACVMARHDPVEAIIRHDLDTEGAQVLAMLTENGPRDDLTPIEEARGYQLALGLNQLTPAKLAKRLGKPRARIDRRIALTKLPERIQDQVHGHQISLTDAEAMVEFAGDVEALDALQHAAGRSSFQYRLEEQRQRRERRRRMDGLRRQLREAGVRIIERPAGYPWGCVEKPIYHFIDPSVDAHHGQPSAAFTPEAHAAVCAFHAAFLGEWDTEPKYVCTNPVEAGHLTNPVEVGHQSPRLASADPAAEVDVAAAEAERLRRAEEEQQRQEEAAQTEAHRREALAVAARLRRGFLGTLLGRSGKGHLQAVLQLILTEHFHAWIADAELEDVHELAGLIDAKLPDPADGVVDGAHWEASLTSLRAALDSRRSPEAIAGGLLAIVGYDREWALTQGHGWGDDACHRYMAFLIAQGYEPTTLERELLDRHDPDTSDVPAVATA